MHNHFALYLSLACRNLKFVGSDNENGMTPNPMHAVRNRLNRGHSDIVLSVQDSPLLLIPLVMEIFVFPQDFFFC